MAITVVAVGRPSGPLAQAVAEYEGRAARYWKLRVVEVDEGAGSGKAGADTVRDAEGRRILRALPEDAAVLLLTRGGKGMTSEGFARYLERQRMGAGRSVGFVIGGAYGVAPRVEERATFRLSLSPMTLPHDLARLALAEQLYRAGTILRGEPYHKGAASPGRRGRMGGGERESRRDGDG